MISSMTKICIDAGHNNFGPDTGAEGNGLREQDLTLDIATRLYRLLVDVGFNVIMTRTGDLVDGLSSSYSLDQSLQRRVQIANAFKADAFISCHINSADSPSAIGSEILIAGTGGQAEQLAKKIEPYLVAVSQTYRGIKVQDVYVLKNTDMPAVLTESGFITNAIDATKLSDPDYRQSIAIAIMKGVCDFYNVSYQNQEGGSDNVLKVAILKYTPEDEWAAKDVDQKLGGVANFTRQKTSLRIPDDAMNAEQLIVIGGPTTGHKNEILLSGKDKYETASKVAAYLKQ